MNSKSGLVRLYAVVVQLLALWIFVAGPIAAQTPLDKNGDPLEYTSLSVDGISASELIPPTFTASELAEMVGPIALYPDNLVAIILPASTYPLEIVLAARFLEQLESDGTLLPDESWDESVTALLNYPEVIQMMNENIQWTWQLGEAVVSQQVDVLEAIGTFRERAYAAGNLKSDEFQIVSNSGDIIEITQVDEKIVYIPYYVVEEVIVEQPRRVYHYYPTAYPLYNYPYSYGHHFSSGYFWGVTTAFSIGWSDHYLHVYHPSFTHHPYYGHHYSSNHHYRRPGISAFNTYYVNNHYRTSHNRYRDGSYWRPQRHSGARPNNSRNRDQYYTGSDQRTAFNGGRYNRGSNDHYADAAGRSNRYGRTNRPDRINTPNRVNTPVLVNNSRPAQSSPQGSRRQNNSPNTDRNNQQFTNAFANSAARVTNPATTGRARARSEDRTERVIRNSARGRDRVRNQVSKSGNSQIVRTTPSQRANVTVNPVQQKNTVTTSSRSSNRSNRDSYRSNQRRAIQARSTSGRSTPVRTASNTRQRIALAPTRSRQTQARPQRTQQQRVQQPRTRQQPAQQTRSREPSLVSRAPTPSRSSRAAPSSRASSGAPASRSSHSQSSSRGSSSSNGGGRSSGNGRSRRIR